MKKRNDIKKGVKKIKKTEDSKVNKRRKQSEPDLWKEIRLNWKGIRSNLKPLGKAYNKFKGKRRAAKEKEERIRDKLSKILKVSQLLARPRGFEPLTLGLENRCSIQLS